MNKEEVYQDTYLRERVKKVISEQQQGKMLLSLYSNDVGLLRADDLNLNPQRLYNSEHEFMLGSIGYLDRDYETGQYKFTLKQGEKLPKCLENYKVLQLGEAVIDAGKRLCTISTESEEITFSGVETWKGNYTLIGEINRELAKANAGVVAWKITTVQSDSAERLYQHGVPSVSNNETHLPVTGYAYREPFNTLIYLGVVGYKTAIMSINATLWQGKGITANIPEGKPYLVLIPVGKYDRTLTPMTEYEAHHCLFLSHAAIPGKWSPDNEEIYLLYFIGCDTIQSQLVSRLNESLNIPILPEWADRITEEGRKLNYIQDLKTGGDCIAGISINVKNADWGKLIEDLLISEQLPL